MYNTRVHSDAPIDSQKTHAQEGEYFDVSTFVKPRKSSIELSFNENIFSSGNLRQKEDQSNGVETVQLLN